MGLTAVNGDHLGDPVATDRLRQKAQRGLWIPVLREQHVNGLAVRIHRPIELPPLPLEADVGLVHAPTDPHRPLPAGERFLQRRAVRDDLPVDRGVINGDPPFLHQFFHVTRP